LTHRVGLVSGCSAEVQHDIIRKKPSSITILINIIIVHNGMYADSDGLRNSEYGRAIAAVPKEDT
jgi:hypothetical protein